MPKPTLSLYPCHLSQVFTSVSTLVFETFDCDDVVGDGEAYLRADYSLSCRSDVHTVFKGYALLMILVSSLACGLSNVWGNSLSTAAFVRSKRLRSASACGAPGPWRRHGLVVRPVCIYFV